MRYAWGEDWDAVDLRVPSADPRPVDEAGLRQRLALAGFSLARALLDAASIPLLVLSILCLALAPIGLGVLLANAVVPATEALTRLQRRLAGRVLDEDVPARYVPARGMVSAPLRWVRDPARWRDVAHLAFSATGGLAMSLLVAGGLTQPVVALLGMAIDPGLGWLWMLVVVSPMGLAVWLFATPALVRVRALVDQAILGRSRVEQLQRRVEEVTASRSETLDHDAAEIRRIERDLHDGAQARMTAAGLHVGMAEQLITKDPAAAAELLRDARESTLGALADLRAVVRGIHPPALADLGLVGGVEALAAAIPLPVTVSARLDGKPPAPVESAVYFAVAECLTNVVKHANPARAWVEISHHGARLRAVVGDDGRGGAEEQSPGLAGVRRRLAAFDGTMSVSSPSGGPTVVVMEVPCDLSSPKTKPSSATD